jgi:alcohol dehydrogenase
VVSGANVVDGVGTELDRLGVSRAVLVTGRTLGASTLLERVTQALGDRCVFVFKGSRQHVPSSTVTELARAMEHHQADSAVSFGGGSPIDTVKAAQHLLLSGSSGGVRTDDGPAHVAIPTTLSAGEFTAVAGITDDQTRIKRPVLDARIAPRVVVVDPTVTTETPGWLWAATGIRSLDHAVETIYSIRRHPLSEAVASRGLALMVQHLPPSLKVADGAASLNATDTGLEARLECQLAAWLCVFGMTNAGFGLSHALGHQIGPRWNVPHGFTSCVTLPHAMRFMADVAPDRFCAIAQGLGVQFDPGKARMSAHVCADRVADFIARFELPHRLRDVGVPRNEIDDIAAVVRDAMEEAGAVDRPVSREEIAALLASAY